MSRILKNIKKNDPTRLLAAFGIIYKVEGCMPPKFIFDMTVELYLKVVM